MDNPGPCWSLLWQILWFLPDPSSCAVASLVYGEILCVTWIHPTTCTHRRLNSELSVTGGKARCRQEHRTGGLYLAHGAAASCFCSFLIHIEVTLTLQTLILFLATQPRFFFSQFSQQPPNYLSTLANSFLLVLPSEYSSIKIRTLIKTLNG